MHFRSIASFVALVCATAVFAVPVALVGDGLAAPVADVTNTGSTVSTVTNTLTQAKGLTPDVASRALAPIPLAQIFKNASDKMIPFIQNLKTAVVDQANVDTEAITSNIQNIIGVLTTLHQEVAEFAQYPVTLVQSLLSVSAILATLCPLLQLLFTVLATVVGVVAATPLGPILTPLIANIGEIVGQILLIVFGIAPGLFTGLLGTLSGLLPALGVLNLTGLLAVVPL